jgi:hypothetical protein
LASCAVILGVCVASVSAAAVIYARRKERLLQSARLNIEGLNLDCLSIANLRRRLNRSLVVDRAFHVAIINGCDLDVAWQYDGFCRSQCETRIEFSIDSENNVPFEDLDCFAFDLHNDPERLQPIRPTLIGSDGVSKKISVSFLQPLTLQQPFSTLLHCTLPGCITTGVQYYTSSLSFDQRSVESAPVHLIFVKCRPEWVRVYESRKGGMALARELRPFRDDGATCEYVDMAQNVPGQSARVYLYDLQTGGGPIIAEHSNTP